MNIENAKTLVERLSNVRQLYSGAHEKNGNGQVEACVMEAVAYVAGEPWSDHPECACPVIGEFLRSWNDALSDDDRNTLILPLVPRLVGTKGSKALEHRRSLMAADWLVRVNTPAWLRLAGLSEHADALAALPEITSMDQVPSIRGPIEAARKDAATAWAAVWAAATDATRDAAWAAAWRDAARDAAWDAAWDASTAASRGAVRAAAWDAACKKLNPVRIELQAPALKLVERMIDEPEPIAKAA